MGTSTTVERTLPIRLLALAAALAMITAGLVASSSAATAEDGLEAKVISPQAGEFVAADGTLKLRAQAPEDASIQWAFRQDSSDRSEGDTYTRAGNVDGFDTDYDFEEGEFVADIDLGAIAEDGDWDFKTEDDYYFVFNVNNDNPRLVVQFQLVDGHEVEECDAGEDCELSADDGEHRFTASVTQTVTKNGRDFASLGLRVPSGGAASAVSAACERQVADSDMRLGDGIAHLVPVGFDGGNVTVTSTIPREHINEAQPRGNAHFQICVAPGAGEADLYGLDKDDDIDGTDGSFVGPILLDDCDGDDDTACIESRNRIAGADLQITYRLPTVDPMLR